MFNMRQGKMTEDKSPVLDTNTLCHNEDITLNHQHADYCE